ncbi:hypothetical protein UPYG_G00116340 [Umbra pygmaea]|uniref:Uncharacterized protein n=1 Tax=Umbra pygmaea TaxID=75934 RepID=A0ABD0X3V7_UMBPY
MEDGEGQSAAHQVSGDGAMSTSDLYSTLGLAPEDVDALAQIPENEISVETLPHLIMHLKAIRAKQEEQGEAPPKKDKQQEDTDVRDPSGEDSSRQDSPPAVTRRSNSRGDTDLRRVEIQSRPERRSGPRRDSHPKIPSREELYDSPSRFPNSYEINDFNGFDPRTFPYRCSICLCMLNSSTTWREHLNGSRHAEGCRKLLHLYPNWENHDSRRSKFISSKDAISQPKIAPRPRMAYKKQHGLDLLRGEIRYSSEKNKFNLRPKTGTNVVVIKFPNSTVTVEDLMALAKPFGIVEKNVMFSCKGFLEFGSHKEALNMVNHYNENKALVKGNKLSVYLLPVVGSFHTPRLDEPSERRSTKPRSNTVVCFSCLPPGKERESEILDIAKMFGDVRHSTFPGDQALIEMVDWEDADIMVKYYHSNPLKIDGKSVKVSFSLKRLRESPDSTSRRDSSKRHSSRQKTEEMSKTSDSTNKEKPSTAKEPAEKVMEQGESQQSTSEEVKEEVTKDVKQEIKKDETEEEEVDPQEEQEVDTKKEGNLENKDEDDEGVQVEDEQNMFEDIEVGACTNAPSKGSSLVTDSKEKGGPEITEVSADDALENSDLKAADDPAVCNADISMEDVMEQRSFHEDDEEELDDFPENMDDFVTLDELDDNGGDESEPDSSWDGKVVHISPILKGYGNALALLNLAERAKVEVVNYSICFFREEALIELDTTEEAQAMVNFYQGKGLLLGRRVNVRMCYTQKTLEGPSGRSVYMSNLPLEKYTDVSLLRIAEPFGKITGYYLNWRSGKCYIQMETVEAANKMVKTFLHRRPKFCGTLLRISLCNKGDSLIPWISPNKYELRLEQNSRRSRDHNEEEETNGQSAKDRSTQDVQSPASDLEGVCGDPEEEKTSAVKTVPEGEKKKMEPLGPYQPDNPVGLDYLVPKTGFFCKLCNIFYTDGKTAKSVHCCSEEHYLKLKRKMEEDEQPSAD